MAVEIRHWRVEDAEAQARAIAESLDHLMPWMPWAAGEPKPLEARVAMLREWEAERVAGTGEYFAVWLDGTVVGSAGLHRRIGDGGLEIGYWIHPGYLRRGLATEVARQLCDRAFAEPDLDRVEIHHDRANVASGGVPAKLGFELVGDERRTPEAPGEEGVERVWRLSREAWTARRDAPRPGRS
ncbi:MAG TPA: GNAT family N-acetyltransferase [Solirubrobacteraceae bacterium]|nr:GNAT family N-acetyltransferase [Solirubrobacteraceae bacterium]